ncbi:MAG: PHP-associated domain-containing protein, partial [Candidatus Hodarchaeota archaeon]
SGLKKRVRQMYPNQDIIRELNQRKIPITLGSDAHSPQDIGFRFEDVFEKTKKWGLTELCQFSRREKNLVPLT